jgi:uncharacterized Ntn-hydrolase superfamily protein
MTWSIIGRDPETGELGAAVASRFFAVGSIVPWVASGVGVVCTQALINPRLGPFGLRLLEVGVPARAAVEALVEGEARHPHRQFHLMSAAGESAAFTGPECVDWAGRVADTDVSVAGNMLAGPQVVQATLEAFLASAGRPLAERLLRGMSAGERAGGDKRGKQSAGILVHGRERYADVSLRCDDHPDPIGELWRLYEVGHERYYGFHAAMPTEASPAGIDDRDVLEGRIQAWLDRHGDVDFKEFWARDPWRE